MLQNEGSFSASSSTLIAKVEKNTTKKKIWTVTVNVEKNVSQ